MGDELDHEGHAGDVEDEAGQNEGGQEGHDDCDLPGDELAVAAAEHRLHNNGVRLALNGEFCVTHVVRDTSDRVRREIAELEERCQHYLALGPGSKALAASIRQVDARHQHALTTICNQKTLDAVVEAAGAAGLKLDCIEPSLVSICRLIVEDLAGRIDVESRPGGPTAFVVWLPGEAEPAPKETA